MNWKCKALLQLILSRAPFSAYLNYFFQKYVTKSFPITDASFIGIISIARRHIGVAQQYCRRPLDQATFYEYGAGWDLISPLTFYMFGVQCQILIDIRYLLRRELVNDTIRRHQTMAPNLGLPRVPNKCIEDKSDFLFSLKKYYGIDYRAPCDARHTQLEAGSIDWITSTNTLEHIPLQDIQAILQECHRLLRDDGLMSCLIDYEDHYSFFDRSISGYNFLQYSDEAWAFFNPMLHYQNRLRHRDYLDLFRAAGFEVVEERHKEGTEADLRVIERLPVDKRFRAYTLPELSIRNAFVVVRKQDMNGAVIRSRF